MPDIFSTYTLNKTVEHLERSASFLLDTFFPLVQTSDSEEIYFDIDKSKPRLAPFVSPLVAGKVVADQGFETKSFRPAYVKDKRRFDAQIPFKRVIGERIGGSLSPDQRMKASLSRALDNQLENLTRREEVMASEALRTGRITVTGDNYPTVVVDFQRDPLLTQTLVGALRWGQAGVKALDNLEQWASLIQSKSGAAARQVIMDPLAWNLFRQSPDVEKLLTIYRGTSTSIQIDPMVRGQGNEKARYRGTIGDFDIWVYNDVYVDDLNVTRNLLPNYTVLLGNPQLVEGTRCYGAIHDEEAAFRAERYFTKSWLEKDPAVRWLLMQSAPLIVPYRPNACFCVTVN